MIHKPILLRAHHNDAQQYLDPNGPPSASATLLFSTPVEESHPGAFADGIFTVPHAANLLVSVAAAAIADENGSRATKGIQILINNQPALNISGVKEAPVVDVVAVAAGDELRIVWQVTEATSLSGNPIETHLSIVELR